MTTQRLKMPDGMNEMWEQVREHHGQLAGLTTTVGSLGQTVTQLGSKVDAVLEAVTRQSARQGPSLAQIMGAALTLCGIIAALCAGVGVYVAASYDGKIVDLKSKAERAEIILSQRDTEDRAELARLREAERFSFGERLRKLEDHSGWTPNAIVPATGLGSEAR